MKIEKWSLVGVRLVAALTILFALLVFSAGVASMRASWLDCLAYAVVMMVLWTTLERCGKSWSFFSVRVEAWVIVAAVFFVHLAFIRVLPALGHEPLSAAWDARAAVRSIEAGRICYTHAVRNQSWCNYEVLLSAMGVMFGGGYQLGQVLNALTCALLVFPVSVLSSEIGGRRMARLTALTMGFSPALLMYSKLLSGEFLSAMLMGTAGYFLFDAFRAPKRRGGAASLVLCGVLIGLSQLFKPISVVFLFAMCALGAVLFVMTRDWKRRTVLVGSVLLVMGTCRLSTGISQNAISAFVGDVRLTTAVSEAPTLMYELVLGFNPETDGTYSGKLAREFLALDATRRRSFVMDRVCRDWRCYPGLMVRKFVNIHGSPNRPHGAVSNFVLSFRDYPKLGRSHAPAWVEPLSDSGALFFRILFLMGATGLALSLRRSVSFWLPGLFSALIILGFAAIEQLIEGHGRYKTAVYPFYFMLIPYAGVLLERVKLLWLAAWARLRTHRLARPFVDESEEMA